LAAEAARNEEGGRGQREPCRPSLMPNDDINFQRFRYSTKEEEHRGGTKGLEFEEGRDPRLFDPETVIVPRALQDSQSSARVMTDGLIAQKYD
jgi:hypothetical protein